MTEHTPEIFGPDELYMVEEALRDTRGLEELYSNMAEGRLDVFRRVQVAGGCVDVGVALERDGRMRMTVGGPKEMTKVVRTLQVVELDHAIRQAQSHLLDYLGGGVSE
jgi:hypothetical protein